MSDAFHEQARNDRTTRAAGASLYLSLLTKVQFFSRNQVSWEAKNSLSKRRVLASIDLHTTRAYPQIPLDVTRQSSS
jgi:hypothetical protein